MYLQNIWLNESSLGVKQLILREALSIEDVIREDSAWHSSHRKEMVSGNHDTRIIGNLRIPKGLGIRLHQDIAWLKILNGFLNRREKSLGND
ncbi:hypothetical protein L2E82_34463 [Cichorium intybus]|uniref:Uncharacterized protein n=1 Tax=Cichorium intybus TaxID=13427 RepID=A0ACB9BMA7_CICIN|nr:hypothetical protein L2E82_34463 [Cichorium intybus]